jgi:hypothetical protein
MSKHDDRPYKVGKGKPPKHTQWRPGQSGNPKGSSNKKRRAKDMDLSEFVRQLANEKVPVTIGGETVSLSKREMILRRLINDGIEGRASHRFKVIEFLCTHGVFDPEAQQEDSKEAQHARIVEFLEALQSKVKGREE